MTCIVAYVDPYGDIIMGGDRALTKTNGLYTSATPKVRRIGSILVGATGPSTLNNLMWAPDWPEWPKDQDLGLYIREVLVRWIHAKCLERGFLSSNHGGGCMEGAFLIGAAGRLFEIDCHRGTSEFGRQIHGIGQCNEAVGALMMTRNGNLPEIHSPQHLVRVALEIAEDCNDGVRSPFDILVLPRSSAP